MANAWSRDENPVIEVVTDILAVRGLDVDVIQGLVGQVRTPRHRERADYFPGAVALQLMGMDNPALAARAAALLEVIARVDRLSVAAAPAPVPGPDVRRRPPDRPRLRR
jgi:hypothetical protein